MAEAPKRFRRLAGRIQNDGNGRARTLDCGRCRSGDDLMPIIQTPGLAPVLLSVSLLVYGAVGYWGIASRELSPPEQTFRRAIRACRTYLALATYLSPRPSSGTWPCCMSRR